MSTKLTITAEQETIRFVGGLDLYAVESARAELLACIAPRPALVLDLSGVSACDAAGWQLLLSLRKTAITGGKPFSMPAISPAVEESRILLGIPAESCQPHTI
jgi:anti-anti-sigma regulatory factor